MNEEREIDRKSNQTLVASCFSLFISDSLERTAIMRKDADATPPPHQPRCEHQQWHLGGESHPLFPRSEYQKIADNLEFASVTCHSIYHNALGTACDGSRQVLLKQ